MNEKVCLICKNPIEESDETVACPDCGKVYHKSCWRITGKCCVEEECREKAKARKEAEKQQQILLQNSASQNTIDNMPIPEQRNRFCKHCGQVVQPEWTVCSNCGNSLVQNSINTMPNNPSVSQTYNQNNISPQIMQDGTLPKNKKKTGIIIAVISVVVIIGIALIVCGIILSNENQSSNVSKKSKKCDHEYTSEITLEATCGSDGELTYTCDLCGDTYTESIPATGDHEYSSEITQEATSTSEGIMTYTCDICGDSYTELIDRIVSNWTISYYSDEFGDDTSDAFVVGMFSGTFSNSATTNSELTALVYLDKTIPDAVFIKLIEYNSHVATFLSHEDIILKIKSESGATSSYNLGFSDGVLGCQNIDLVNKIRNNKSLSCVISTESAYQTVSDTYLFKIDNIGLDELYNKT